MTNPGPPDSFHLSASVGWLELGNRAEARLELEKISPRWQLHPKVLEVRWNLAADEGNWEEALLLASDYIRLAPKDLFGWVHRSFSLHELKRTKEAMEALMPAFSVFSLDSIIPFNLACYACQLGLKDQAWSWLRRAMEVGGVEEIKAMALEDPDLQPFWAEIEELKTLPPQTER